VQIRLFERPGVALGVAMQKEVEKHFIRQELRRVPFGTVGTVVYPARARESYATDLLAELDVEAIRSHDFRIVVDYGYSAGSYVLPLVLGPLGVEAVTAHAFESDSGAAPVRIAETVDQARRLVTAVDATFGAVFDRSAERLFLIDETGREIRPDQALLLFLHLISLNGGSGAVAVPITATSQVEEVVGDRFQVVRTQATLAGLTQAATADGIVFAGAPGGGYVFPGFLPAYDAIASLCKLLELLAAVEQPMSALVSQLPRPTLIHRQVQCPWALKGTVMRVLNERYAEGDVDVTDGIKIFDERGWVQVLPDADEPVIHLYAEGDTTESSEDLERELRTLVTEVIEREEIGART
jgi:mannose-1-phosphate guanylyltransferase/phosphomannomutase